MTLNRLEIAVIVSILVTIALWVASITFFPSVLWIVVFVASAGVSYTLLEILDRKDKENDPLR
jgi:ABC-type Fe3+-siderophore transport system permease subunit